MIPSFNTPNEAEVKLVLHRRLLEESISFKIEESIQGVRPDITIYNSESRIGIVEVKRSPRWFPNERQAKALEAIQEFFEIGFSKGLKVDGIHYLLESRDTNKILLSRQELEEAITNARYCHGIGEAHGYRLTSTGRCKQARFINSVNKFTDYAFLGYPSRICWGHEEIEETVSFVKKLYS